MKTDLHYSIDRVACELKARGYKIKHSDLIESLAKGFGYRTSNAMLADAKKASTATKASLITANKPSATDKPPVERLWEAVESRDIWIIGPTGSFKTTIAQQAAAGAARKGIQVFWLNEAKNGTAPTNLAQLKSQVLAHQSGSPVPKTVSIDLLTGDPATSALTEFEGLLKALSQRHQRSLVILDEASCDFYDTIRPEIALIAEENKNVLLLTTSHEGYADRADAAESLVITSFRGESLCGNYRKVLTHHLSPEVVDCLALQYSGFADRSVSLIARNGIETMFRLSPDPTLTSLLRPGIHAFSDGTRRPDLHAWWERFNQELRARGLPEAGFGLARDYFSEGCTPAEAAETEVLVDNPMAH